MNKILSFCTKPMVIVLSFGFVMGYLAHDFINKIDRKFRKW
jgi:hypothetical protein